MEQLVYLTNDTSTEFQYSILNIDSVGAHVAAWEQFSLRDIKTLLQMTIIMIAFYAPGCQKMRRFAYLTCMHGPAVLFLQNKCIVVMQC